jgi:hypothetical protein
MRGTGIEKEAEICATNITNKTKCMSTHAKEMGGRKMRRHVVIPPVPSVE